jgi:hypothetical protein
MTDNYLFAVFLAQSSSKIIKVDVSEVCHYFISSSKRVAVNTLPTILNAVHDHQHQTQKLPTFFCVILLANSFAVLSLFALAH